MTHYPVFLINLDRQSDRLALMADQLAQVGVTATRIAAFDGKKAGQMKTASVASYAPLTPGEVGCFESHRDFWARVAAGTAAGAYVLEDDMLVASDFAEIRFPPELLEKADLIKIDQSRPLDSSYGTQQIALGADRYVVRLLGTEMSTGCYFVTKKGAKRLLAMSKNYFQPVDTFLFDRASKTFVDLEVWKLCAAAAVQIHMQADIQSLGADFQDRIQGAARPENEAGLGGTWRRLRIRLRRFLDADTRQKRVTRSENYMESFAASEPLEKRHVTFASPHDDHLALVLSKAT